MSWKASALKHARELDPEEACGLVCVVKGRKKYWPCRNAADLPNEGFLLHPDDWMEAEDAGEIVGVFHSHPGESAQPSEVDLASCEYIDLPFYICNPETEEWSEFKPSGYKAGLIGRTWAWGSADCWTLVIDWFADKGLKVKDWERPKLPEDILTNGIFERLIPQSGFRELRDDEDLTVGDLLLMKSKCLDSKFDPDHVALYIGDQTVLHHVGGRLSSRDLYNQFLIDETVRRYRHAQAN